ncbi:uncharacterized protein METZ01_LOCUS290885 [marine metagenome]|uniref:Uncharacterized protein n=1 Tax=marine metagenome TaxID=408172 RepID=A0A382LSZ4_9ZZZZ
MHKHVAIISLLNMKLSGAPCLEDNDYVI